jgi:hypothetical protein
MSTSFVQQCCAHCYCVIVASRRGSSTILCEMCERGWESQFAAVLSTRRADEAGLSPHKPQAALSAMLPRTRRGEAATMTTG